MDKAQLKLKFKEVLAKSWEFKPQYVLGQTSAVTMDKEQEHRLKFKRIIDKYKPKGMIDTAC
jgi:hypothetical protein